MFPTLTFNNRPDIGVRHIKCESKRFVCFASFSETSYFYNLILGKFAVMILNSSWRVFSSFSVHIRNIFLMCPHKKMTGSYAGRVIAFVASITNLSGVYASKYQRISRSIVIFSVNAKASKRIKRKYC